MNEFSIEDQKEVILNPNSEFERRVIFQYYLDNLISINNVERAILNQCKVSEPESIGIIGCLLADKTHLNVLRLAIGAKNNSNKKLSELSSSLFSKETLKKADDYFAFEVDFLKLNEVEVIVDNVYNTVYYSKS